MNKTNIPAFLVFRTHFFFFSLNQGNKMSITAIALYSFLLKKQNQNTQLYSKPYCSTMSSFCNAILKIPTSCSSPKQYYSKILHSLPLHKSNQEKKKRDSDMYLVNFLHQAQQVSNLFFLT